MSKFIINHENQFFLKMFEYRIIKNVNMLMSKCTWLDDCMKNKSQKKAPKWQLQVEIYYNERLADV